ncbi:hypothetical protein BD408DRAFT_473327 [Parasitella parasitica]|nr:hypothetical protein BD408DRAFT_473327 [Parasitella parasitica]
MPPRFGGAPKCPRCEKSVYMAEQVLGPGGQWHNYCLTCKECNKRLDSTTLTEKDNEAYCRIRCSRKWGPKGYGFAGGAAFLSTENKMPSEILNHTSYVPRKFGFQAQQDICTGCGKIVYAAELALGAGNKYHKMCLKCCQCGKRLDSTNMVDRDFDLYCRGCYSKSFDPKGYGYNNLLTPEGATR